VGKSTQIKLLERVLVESGHEVIHTQDPQGTVIGMKIRGIVLEKELKELTPKTELLLFLAARAQLVSEIIKPGVEAGKIVISDRFYHSTLAYQGGARELGIEEVRRLNDYAIADIHPDLTFLLDLPPEVGFDRMRPKNGKGKELPKNQINLSLHLSSDMPRLDTDRIEREDANFHEKVRRAFLQLAREEPHRVVVLDASRPVEEIAAEIKRRVIEKLG